MSITNNKFLLFLFFSFLFYGVLIYSFHKTATIGIQTHKNNLIEQADIHYQDIINTRAWNAKLGGVYAYPGKYKPNPYLKHNTIKDSNNKTLIKINPAWMTRMLSENSKNEKYKFYLKSNTPVNPKNKAEGFYAESLASIIKNNNANDLKRYRFVEDKKSFEYIKGLYVKKACMPCHKENGDKVGDLRGGVAIEMNAQHYFSRVDDIWGEFYKISIIVTFLFIILIVAVYKFLKRTQEVEVLNLNLEDKIREKTSKLDNALAGAGLGYWSWNIQTDEHSVDDRWLSLFGLTKHVLNNKIVDWNSKIHPDDLEKTMQTIKSAISKNKPYVVEFRMMHEDGRYIWIQESGAIIFYDAEHNPYELAGTHQDITKRKALELKEVENSVYLNTLFEHNPNIIIVTNGGKILKTNQAFFNFFNEYASLDTFLKEYDCICQFFEVGEDENLITNTKNEWIKEVFIKEEPIAKITKNSKIHYFAVKANKIFEDNYIHYMVTFSDITETYNLKKEYETLSITDALTGLYNRRHFNKVFSQEINRALRFENSLSFLILDIDYFKLYNDNYGHDAGDELLQQLAKELNKSLKRANEFIFRIGGEEFGVIYSELSKEDSIAKAQTICDSVSAMNLKHEYSLVTDKLTVSIGHFYTTSSELLKPETIYHKADKALYYAKEHGRNRVEDYGENFT